MEISKENLFIAASKIGISQKQAETLWVSLENYDDYLKPSPFSKLLFYFGALIIISAMTWFMSLSWEWFGSGTIFLISIAYASLFTFIGAKLWKKNDLKTAGGLLVTTAVCMMPLIIYSLETYLNIWPENYSEHYRDFFTTIKGSWIFMELGTILAGLIALRFFSFPFLTAPIFFAAWFFTIDITPIITGNHQITWEQKEWISLFFGGVLLVIAYVIDRKKTEDYSFWGYFFGAIAFWISLSSLSWGKSELIFIVYLIINFIMMVMSILLKRKVLMLFGALGTFIYFSHLAYEVFENTSVFPFALSLIGLIVIYLGTLYQKNSEWIEQKIIELCPPFMRHLSGPPK